MEKMYLEFLKRNRIAVADRAEILRVFASVNPKRMGELLEQFPEIEADLGWLLSDQIASLKILAKMEGGDYWRKFGRSFYQDGLYNTPESEIKRIMSLHRLSDQQAHLTLDLGCGTAFRSAFLFGNGYLNGQCIGLDQDFKSLEKARAICQKEAINNVKFIQGVCTEIPFPDETFDQIHMILVLTWVDDWMLALSEAGRVLKPGGKLIMAYCNELPGRPPIPQYFCLMSLAEIGIYTELYDDGFFCGTKSY